MKTLPVLGTAVMLLAACTVPPGFTTMSEEELAAYNRDKPLLQQVYCTTEAQTSSRIRKTRCDTVEGWSTHNQRTIMAIDTISMPR